MLQREKLVLGDYRSQRVYLTPEGYIKVFLLEVDPSHKHTTYHKCLICPQSHPEYCLPPEQLKDISQLSFRPTQDVYQSEVHNIGMLMMELITLDHPKHYYESQSTYINTDKINYQLQHAAYSHSLTQLIANMLHPDPKCRCTLEQALSHAESAKKGITTAHAIQLLESHSKHKPK